MQELLDFIRTPAGVAVLFAGLAVLSYIVMLLRHRVEDRRKKAQEISAELRTVGGFKFLPTLLDEYAVGDYSGMLRTIVAIGKMLKNKPERVAEFFGVGDAVLKDMAQDPAYRPQVVKLMADLQGLLDQHLPDKASAFGAAADQALSYKTLHEEAKERVQAFAKKLGMEVIPTVAAAVVPPAAPVIAAVTAAVAASNQVTVPDGHSVTISKNVDAPAA